jgi:hypothetical protein
MFLRFVYFTPYCMEQIHSREANRFSAIFKATAIPVEAWTGPDDSRGP